MSARSPLQPGTTLTLGPADEAGIAEIESLARGDDAALGTLVARFLAHPSWAVRRVVVARVAPAGRRALPILLSALTADRTSETRIAATVDALAALDADFNGELATLTRDENVAVVCDALQIIGRRRERALAPRVAELTAHPDDNVAIAAIEALGRLGGVGTLAPLIAAVESRNFFRAFPALDVLGRTGDARAVAPLVALLSDGKGASGPPSGSSPGPYALEALRALGHTGQPSAVAPLLAHLGRSSDAVVRTAAVALADLRDRFEARFGEAEPLKRSHAESAPFSTRRVVDCLADASPVEVSAIVRTLGWIGDDVATTHLVDLASVEGPARALASEALRKLGRDACGPIIASLARGVGRAALLPLVVCHHAGQTITACLADEDANVRVLACEALARVGATVAVPSLFNLLRDRDPRVSQGAAAAIQSLGSIDTRRLALAEARSEDPSARRAALRIVAYFGYPEALDILVEATTDADERVRESAVQGLAQIDDSRAAATLLTTLGSGSPRTRSVSARALGQVPSTPEVRDALDRVLDDEDAWVRYYACQSLGKLRANERAPRLIARLEDAAGQVRIGAIEALARLQAPDAIAALLGAARSEDGDVRRAALVGLGIARRPEGVALLREATLASESATRLVAISALAEFDQPEIVSALRYAAKDAEASVRGAAIGFLSTRTGREATEALLDLLLDPLVRERALSALAVAPEERIEATLDALERANAETAPIYVTALTRMRRASADAAMATALHSDNVEARRAAAAGLASLATPEGREALSRAVSDADPEVRRICVAAVRR